MFTLLFFIPVAILFTAINIVLGCYIVIRLGYGPPNWQTALNQAVRLTTLQNYLNAGRERLEKKVPKVDQFLTRLHVPKPIIIIDTTYVEEEEYEEESEIMAVEGVSDEEIDEAEGDQLTKDGTETEQSPEETAQDAPTQEPETEPSAVPE